MKRMTVAVASALSAVIGSAAFAAPNAFADTTTLPNGFTAAVVAHSGQKITGAVDATGYDLGIYIGPGVHGVTVDGANVTGANDEGILVQDTSGVVIKNSTVAHNSVNKYAGLTELKAITLAGTNGVLVTDNVVEENGDGGIGIYDDGPNSPSAPTALDASPRPGIGNVIARNTIVNNFSGCGIVVSAKDEGGVVKGTTVSFNTVTASAPGALGGIIIAAGSFGAATVTDTIVSGNSVTGGYIAGIGMHASGAGVLSGTRILDNSFSHNGGQAAPHVGVELLASTGGTIEKTQVLNDKVSDDVFGVYHLGDTATHVSHLSTTRVTAAIGPLAP